MKLESIAECSTWNILQYFIPALSDKWSWKPIFGVFESGCFTHVLLYIHCFTGDGFQDVKDSQWGQDSKLEPVDLNKLNARSFIVYKFGCFVSELVAAHCQHNHVTILLADKIPRNEQLGRNPYRNSFSYDATNHILYVRTARLDSVGEFVVVLVHTLAHIKSGKNFFSLKKSVLGQPIK